MKMMSSEEASKHLHKIIYGYFALFASLHNEDIRGYKRSKAVRGNNPHSFCHYFLMKCLPRRGRFVCVHAPDRRERSHWVKLRRTVTAQPSAAKPSAVAARISAVPFPTAVTSPFSSTRATLSSLLV